MRRLILSLVLGLAAPAWAQPAETVPAAPGVTVQDVTAQNAVVEFGGPDPVVVHTQDGRHVFTAELATTPEQMQRGLMWRESLDADAGMLFHYDPPRRAAMWMDNTLIDLDLLYIDPDGRIAKIIAHAQAGSRRSLPANAVVAGVLEIPAGRAIELGIRPGDTVHHAIFGNAEAAEGGISAGDAGEPAAADATEDTQ
jgi:hypothetical protein